MTVTQTESLDLLPIVRTFKVLDKKKRLIPFEPNWAQQQILEQVRKDFEAGRPTRIICLKARQIGISTVTEAIIFAKALLMPHTEAVVASLDTEQAEYLFDMTKRFYDEWEFKDLYPPKYASKRQMFLEGVESDINVKTGENPKSFRGRTYTDAHVSEVAFWTQPVEAMLALNQGMPDVQGNFQLVESTANGIGNWFHDEWENAEKGKNGYTPFFFPWFKHHEYIPCTGEGCRDGTCAICTEETEGLKPRDAEERDLLKMGATKAHLAWRRWTIRNKCHNNLDLFHQEFPATAEQAFIASGVNAFNLDDLKAVYEEEEPDIGRLEPSASGVRFVMDPDGPWKIYRYPAETKNSVERWGEYFVGGDPSYGYVDSDFAAGQVINRRTKEQCAVFHARIEPGAFADQLALGAKFYNEATIACEVEGGGGVTVERLRHIYPRLYYRRVFDVVPGQDRSDRAIGWSTNWKTKAQLVLKGAEQVATGNCVIHDEATFREMRGYSFYSGKGNNDKFGPADEKKGRDDLVMSWCIAITCEATEAPLASYEVSTAPQGPRMAREPEDEGEEW